jgi:uncharacterized membrane protein
MADPVDPYDLKPDEPRPPQTTLPPPPAGFVPPRPKLERATDEEVDPELSEEVKKYQGVAIAGYLLFFVPLLFGPSSRFCRFHANQGLIVNILWALVVVLIMVRMVALWLLYQALPVPMWTFVGIGGNCVCAPLIVVLIISIICLILFGIIHTANGEMRPLPLFGRFTLIPETIPAGSSARSTKATSTTAQAAPATATTPATSPASPTPDAAPPSDAPASAEASIPTTPPISPTNPETPPTPPTA